VIYADENVWMPVVEGLRRRGRSVTTAMDEDTLGDADADQLDHAGIVFVSQHERDVGEPVKRIDAALQHNTERGTPRRRSPGLGRCDGRRRRDSRPVFPLRVRQSS